MWDAARYGAPGIVAHQTTLRDGEHLSIPDFGDPPGVGHEPRFHALSLETITMVQTITVPIAVARRYLLGVQGLWPGRRWAGKEGAATAIHELGAVQVDPITVVARSHDLVLWSRVMDYAPAHLDDLLYRERRFFDYGAHLDIYPMEVLPDWRLHMHRRAESARWAGFAAENGALIAAVRQHVQERGPLRGRDIKGGTRIESYRGNKDTDVALYFLWLVGELMTHHREGFARVYDLRERIAPPAFQHEASVADTERHFAVAALRQLGLGTRRAWAGAFAYALHLKAAQAAANARLEQLVEAGTALPIQIEGIREPYCAPASALPLFGELLAGRIPEAWSPLDTTTSEEVVLLSPLDNLLERQRTRTLFDFDYVWEVYKPPAQRRWGRYTLPILYGDQLVARLEPRLDRKARTLTIETVWLEDQSLASDHAFLNAFARGLTRFAYLNKAESVDISPTSSVLDSPSHHFLAAG